MTARFRMFLLGCVLMFASLQAGAQTVAKVRTLAGDVSIERGGARQPAVLGGAILEGDRILTGRDGTVGLLFEDDSRMSLGPGSALVVDRFTFDFGTHDGALDVSMRKGTLSVVAGKLTAKTPGALKVRTPAAILAVRGTEFSVRIDDPDEQGAPR